MLQKPVSIKKLTDWKISLQNYVKKFDSFGNSGQLHFTLFYILHFLLLVFAIIMNILKKQQSQVLFNEIMALQLQ